MATTIQQVNRNIFNKPNVKNEIRDVSGNLVGYDTGNQSVVATQQEKLLDRVKRGGGSRESTQPIQSQAPEPKPAPQIPEPTKKEDVLRVGRGGVTYGGSRDTGNVIVPNTREMTANQLQQQAFLEARKQYGTGVKKYSSYTATYTAPVKSSSSYVAKDARQIAIDLINSGEVIDYLQKPSNLTNPEVRKYIKELSGLTRKKVTNKAYIEAISNTKLVEENTPSRSELNNNSVISDTLRDYQQKQNSRSELYLNEFVRYKNLGYNDYQANILANESANKGGFSFSSEGARKTIGNIEKQNPLKTIGSYLLGNAGADPKKEVELNNILSNSYETLLTQGGAKYIPIKFSREVGTKYFGFTSDVLAGATKNKPLSTELKEKGGKVIGDTLLWGFFSPAMNTGSYAEAFESLSQNKKSKYNVLSKSRFSSATEEATAKTIAEDTLNKIKLDLVNKKNVNEQLSYLKSIRNQINDPEAIKNFQDFLRSLIEDGTIKLNSVKIVGNNIITNNIVSTPTMNVLPNTKIDMDFILSNIPQMQNIGFLTGGANLIRDNYNSLDIKNENKLNIDNKENNKSKSPLLSTLNILNSFQDFKVYEGSKNKQEELQKDVSIMTPSMSYKSMLSSLLGQKQGLIQKQTYVQSNLKQLKKGIKPKKFNFFTPNNLKSVDKKEIKDEFNIFVKEKGEFKKVGSAKTSYLAGQKLQKELFKNLRASGYVATKEGKRISLNQLGLSPKFRPSKMFEDVAVQRQTGKGGRLTTFGERKSIQRAKKMKYI